jgi:hypothetical protein
MGGRRWEDYLNKEVVIVAVYMYSPKKWRKLFDYLMSSVLEQFPYGMIEVVVYIVTEVAGINVVFAISVYMKELFEVH